MRHPLLILCEPQRGLTEMLRQLALAQGWAFRARHRPSSIPRLLRQRHPSVLVLRVGARLLDRSLEREMTLLDRSAWLIPDTPVIVALDVETPALVSLAWDLGASAVLFTPQCRDRLADLAMELMKEAVDRAVG